MKKALEAVDGFIHLADFLKEVKETIPKLEDIPNQVKNLEATKKALSEEVDSLNKTRLRVKEDIEAEKEKEIQQINSKTRELSEKTALLDQERTQIKNELLRIETRDKELTSMIAGYERAIEEAKESKAKLDEKLKAIGEVAVA